MKSDFETGFTGWAFLAAALMLWAGWVLIPVQIESFFKPEDFAAIQDSLRMWVWMYRVHIFGMIATIVAVVSLGAAFPPVPERVLVYPGIAVMSAGMVSTALGAAFFYQFGASGAIEMQGVSAEVIGEFVKSLKLDSQYAGCFLRFGRVFTGLGMVLTGMGLWRSGVVLPSWIGYTAVFTGIVTMALIMAFPDNEAFYFPLFHLKNLWLVVTGIAILKYRLDMQPPIHS